MNYNESGSNIKWKAVNAKEEYGNDQWNYSL